MTEDVHVRAGRLIAQERVEGISAEEQRWLGQHLDECAACSELARSTGEAIRGLRVVSIAVPRGLASRTQMRVRLRAEQLRAYEPRWRMLWIACGISWVFGAATAPFIWRALEWTGHRLGVPNFVWEMGFGLWWALPAAVAGLVVLITVHAERRETDWKRQQN